MSTETFTPRQPRGIPVGGQFSTKPLDEADVSLGTEAPQEDQQPRAFADTPEVFTKKYETLDEKVKAFKAELDAAVAGLATDDNWLNYCQTMSRFHRYSASNQMLIMLQTGGKATRVAGFRAWQEKFDRTVNKGEKAIAILAPRMATVAEKDAKGKPVLDAKGKAKKTKRPIGFTTASVFDVSQTSGEPLPEIETELSETPPAGFLDDMESAAQAAGYAVRYEEMNSHANGTAQGWTDPRSKEIVIDSALSEGSVAATLAHELGHVYAGHCEPGNLDDYHVGPGGCRGRMEVEADSVGYALLRANGVQPGNATKLSAQYVAGWSKHDPHALRESADTVSKATKKVLESTRFRNVDE